MSEPADNDTTNHVPAAAGVVRPGPADTAINAVAALVDAALAAQDAIRSWAGGERDGESTALWAQVTTLRKDAMQLGVEAARVLAPQQVDGGDTIYHYRQLTADDPEFCSLHLDRPAVGRTIHGPGRGTRRYACQQCWDEAEPWTRQLAAAYMASIGWNTSDAVS